MRHRRSSGLTQRNTFPTTSFFDDRVTIFFKILLCNGAGVDHIPRRAQLLHENATLIDEEHPEQVALSVPNQSASLEQRTSRRVSNFKSKILVILPDLGC